MSTQGPAETITFDDFQRIKLRVGTVVEAHDHPNADKLIVIKVDLGDEQRQICAGLRGFYSPEQLLGQNLVIVTNLAPRMMRGVESNGMLLAAGTPERDRVVTLTTSEDMPPGCSVS